MAGRGQAGTAIAALGLVLLLSGGVAQSACALPDLGWMAGDWKYVTPEGVTHERWVIAPAGEMLGFTWGPNREQPGDVARLASITRENGALVLQMHHYAGAASRFEAQPGDDPITFRATACGRAFATFEGVGKWVGDRTIYTRDGDALTVEGQVVVAGKFRHYRVALTKE